jgi:peroxiredoxin
MIGFKAQKFLRSLIFTRKQDISVGQKIPNMKVNVIEYANGVYLRNFYSTSSLFDSGKYVLFGFSGAFNQSCEEIYIPEYIKRAKELKDIPIEFYAMGVNDPYVMKEFAEKMKAVDLISFIADGSGEFSRALDVLVDLSEKDMGQRCRYFNISIRNGVVVQVNDSKEAFTLTMDNINPLIGTVNDTKTIFKEV